MRRLSKLLVAFALGVATAYPTCAWAAASSGASPEPDSPPPLAEPALLADLIERVDRARMFEDPRWLALLHYERDGLRLHARSRASTPSFFLAETGDRDARAELIATLRAFLDPTAIVKDDEHAQCAFVARRHWLSSRLELRADELPTVACSHYERWRTGLDARGLTLVFPEGFMGNPGSIFGHTLLRIDSENESKTDEILGYAVDFTADAGDDRLLKYIVKGIGGFYPAIFGVHPYYDQLKRYADWENRDIWEYRLQIDESQLDFLLMHLWELRGIEFPYYFFTKNCSYELLRLLETGIDGLDVSSGFFGPVLPIDTVRAVAAQPNLVADTRYRASPETQLRGALRTLSRADREHVYAIAAGRLSPDDASLRDLPANRRARILDVAYDQLRYEYLAGQVSDEASRGLSRRILIARSQVEGVPDEPSLEAAEVAVPETSPDQGHDTSLLAVQAGWRDDESFIDIRLRPAFHGLMDASRGYLPHTQIRILDTVMRIYPESGRVRLQELTLVEILSLSPRSRIFKPWAWSVGTGLSTRRVPSLGGLADAPVWGTEMGVGLSWDATPSLLVYGLADLRLDVGPDLDHDVSFGPGARVGGFFEPPQSRWKGHVFAEVTRFAAGDTTTSVRSGMEGRLSTSRNTALILEATFNRSYGQNWAEGSLQLNLHF